MKATLDYNYYAFRFALRAFDTVLCMCDNLIGTVFKVDICAKNLSPSKL